MFRIGEFSKLTQVSIRMLRYYDETGLLKPAETDMFTGYRLYSADQIPRLNKIIFLRDTGFNVSEIAVALEHWTDDFITNRLEHKYHEVEKLIEAEQNRLSKIALAIRDIRQEKIAVHYNVMIKSIPAYQVLSLRKIIPDYYAEGELWKEMSGFAEKRTISISDHTFSIYYDEEHKERDVDVELCVPVLTMGKDEDGFVYRRTAPVPVMASTMAYGPFRNIAGAYMSFADWLQEHDQYGMAGPTRQIVHRGPWNEDDPEQYLTEIQIPLEKKPGDI